MVNNYTLTYGIGDSRSDVVLAADAESALLTNLTADQLYTFILRVNYTEGGINQIANDALEQEMTLGRCEWCGGRHR